MEEIAYVYVDEHAISSALYCPICLDILQEPHTHVPCDSAFCRSCLLQLAEPHCPICRWTWNETLPLEYNTYLPKANRLIRNMLDDLRVKCIYCHTIRRRGQFEHQCEPMNMDVTMKSLSAPASIQVKKFSRMIFALLCFLWISLVYHNRENLFQSAITNRTHTIHAVATNLDEHVLETLHDILMNLLNYSIIALLINIFSWLCVKFFGEHYMSKTTSRILENVFETSLILNLIICSFYH